VVAELLAQLPPADAELIRRAFGLSCPRQKYRDLAAEHGTSPQALSARLKRILGNLRRLAHAPPPASSPPRSRRTAAAIATRSVQQLAGSAPAQACRRKGEASARTLPA